ncbi:MAG: alpha/beta hydrolase [Candidatus Shapirobacteria bacterium]
MNNKKLRHVLFLFLLPFSLALKPKISFAQTILFYDNFDSARENWKIQSQNWNVIDLLGNGVLQTSFFPTDTQALIFPDNLDSHNWQNYSVEASLYSINGVDQMVWIRTQENNGSYSYYSVNLRAKGWVDSDNIRVKKVIDDSHVWLDQLNPPEIGCSIENDYFYNIIFSAIEDKISLQIKCPSDSEYRLIYEKIDSDPIVKGGFALQAWSGHWYMGVEKIFDNIRVSGFDQTEKSIIILPGLGASWNTEAILLDKEKPQGQWQMTPFVNIYDNLVGSLENNGYQIGNDLFIFNYDWRQPVNQIAQDLDAYIDNNLSNQEVDLIGHSLGGLVARAWWQDNNDEQVGKIITLGSPHQGVLQAYEALAGGKISSDFSWGAGALNILLNLRYPHYKTTAQILQKEVPVLFDLMPVFDFLKKGRNNIPWENLSFTNNWLKDSNDSLADLDKLNFISGNNGKNVNELFLVKSPTLIEDLLGLWPDGVPYRYYQGDGDSTVLLKSTFLEPKNSSVYSLNHRQIISDSSAIEKIFELLNISPQTIIQNEPYSIDNTLVFLIASPAYLQITSPDKKIYLSDPQGFIVIPSPLAGDYQAEITGTGNGEYHFLIGQLFSDQLWDEYQGTIENGSTINYLLSIDPNSPQKNPIANQKENQLNAALIEIKNLQEKSASKFLGKARAEIEKAINKSQGKNWAQAIISVKKAINYLFSFRKEQADLYSLKQSEKSLYLLSQALSVLLKNERKINPSTAKKDYLQAQKQQSLGWQKIRLLQRRKSLNDLTLVANQTGAKFLEKAKDYLAKKDLESLSAFSFTSSRFFREFY